MPDSLLRNPRIFLLGSASSTFSARAEKVAQRVDEGASGEVGGTAGRFPFTLDPEALGELGCQVQARPDRDDLRLELDGDDVEPSSRDVDAGATSRRCPSTSSSGSTEGHMCFSMTLATGYGGRLSSRPRHRTPMRPARRLPRTASGARRTVAVTGAQRCAGRTGRCWSRPCWVRARDEIT